MRPYGKIPLEEEHGNSILLSLLLGLPTTFPINSFFLANMNQTIFTRYLRNKSIHISRKAHVHLMNNVCIKSLVDFRYFLQVHVF